VFLLFVDDDRVADVDWPQAVSSTTASLPDHESAACFIAVIVSEIAKLRLIRKCRERS